MKPFDFGRWSIFDAIDAIMAQDLGATDSGVSFPDLRKALIGYLGTLNPNDFRVITGLFARRFLEKDSLEAGYGVADVVAFHEWLERLGLNRTVCREAADA